MKNEKPKVLVTRAIPSEGLDLLNKHCEVTLGARDRMLGRKELLDLVKGKDALLSMLTDRVDRELMEIATDLKVVSNFAVGFDNIDVEEATRRGIVVTHTPEVLTDATADLAFTLLLDVARRVTEGIGSPGQGGGKSGLLCFIWEKMCRDPHSALSGWGESDGLLPNGPGVLR